MTDQNQSCQCKKCSETILDKMLSRLSADELTDLLKKKINEKIAEGDVKDLSAAGAKHKKESYLEREVKEPAIKAMIPANPFMKWEGNTRTYREWIRSEAGKEWLRENIEFSVAEIAKKHCIGWKMRPSQRLVYGAKQKINKCCGCIKRF